MLRAWYEMQVVSLMGLTQGLIIYYSINDKPLVFHQSQYNLLFSLLLRVHCVLHETCLLNKHTVAWFRLYPNHAVNGKLAVYLCHDLLPLERYGKSCL